MTRPIYDSFEDYIQAHPEGESLREWLTNGGRRDVILLPADTVENVLPGNYYWAFMAQYPDNPRHKKRNRFYVHIADNDDGEVTHTYGSEEEAKKAFADLRSLAPFYLYDLKEFGYDEWTN